MMIMIRDEKTNNLFPVSLHNHFKSGNVI